MLNYSICFSAKSDYFAETKALAEPAVRFYTKLYLQPFTLEEIVEYTRSVFDLAPDTRQESPLGFTREPSDIRIFLPSCASTRQPR
jgi:hypothetical protein